MSNKSSDHIGQSTDSAARDNKRSFRQKAIPLAVTAALLVGGAIFTVTGMQEAAQSSSQEATTPVITLTDSKDTLASHKESPVATPVPTQTPDVEVVAATPPAEVVTVETPAPAAPVSAPLSFPASTLNIPSLGISTAIVSGGENSGGMVLPESSKVAEFAGAASLASTKGSTVIAGHVNFADGSAGALGPLHTIATGAPIYATDAAGKVHEYRVTNTTVLHKQALPAEIFRTAGSKQLVVVTCGGALEMVNGAWAYTHNFIATAELV